MVRISEFQIKDVVNVADGKKLGNISDIDINLTNGKIDAIVVSGAGGRMLGFFGKEEEMVIPWRNILKIGEDVILVRFKSTNEMAIAEEEARL